MLKRILPKVRRILTERNLTLTFVDIGSRNGVLELGDLADFIEAYGFEPNPEEYDKLISGQTDLVKVGGMSSPKYRRLSYQPYAIGDRNGTTDFYITPGPGACGMLEPDLERLREIIWKGKRYQKNFGEDIFSAYRKIQVPVRTLDTFVSEAKLRYIDYLKIDVEGSEYEVFAGGRNILARTGIIKVETCFIPFRKGQKMFSHVDLLLREYGFDLIRYEIQQAQIGYKERVTPVEYLPGRFSDPYGQPLSCDAIYINRSIDDPERALGQAVVLMEKKYFDEAAHILRVKTTVNAPELTDILRSAEYYDAIGYRLKALGYRVIDKVIDNAAAVRQALGL